MAKRPAYRIIYNLQRSILITAYLIAAIALSLLLIRLVQAIFPNQLYPLLAAILLYLVVVVVFGAFIYYVSFIPFNLGAGFDPVKNDVASGKIRDMEGLAARICEFNCRFFDFSFLDISHCVIQLENDVPYAHQHIEELEKILIKLNMPEAGKQLDGIARAGKISIGDTHYQLYILPICFEDRFLGTMALFTRNRIGYFFRLFLMAYEEDYLDDLLMLMLNMNAGRKGESPAQA